MTSLPPLLTADEVAHQLRLDAETVRRWAREGRIPAILLPGGQWRIRSTDLDRILAADDTDTTEVPQ